MYKIAYKTVTELEWRCCPGYRGHDCMEVKDMRLLQAERLPSFPPVSGRRQAPQGEQQWAEQKLPVQHIVISTPSHFSVWLRNLLVINWRFMCPQYVIFWSACWATNRYRDVAHQYLSLGTRCGSTPLPVKVRIPVCPTSQYRTDWDLDHASILTLTDIDLCLVLNAHRYCRQINTS